MRRWLLRSLPRRRSKRRRRGPSPSNSDSCVHLPKFATSKICRVAVGQLRSAFKNDYEALVEALLLALIAPSDKKAKEATKLAESFAATLSTEDINKAKKAAKKRFSCVASLASVD